MPNTENRKISELRPHPENARLFASPDDCDEYDDIKASIKKYGMWEPIVVKKDGTILSGHLRVAAMRELGHKEIACRVMEFSSYRQEVTFLIRTNTDRRQLKPSEKAYAFELLKRLPAEQGGAKQKPGNPNAATANLHGRAGKPEGSKGAACGTIGSEPSEGVKTRDEAAKEVGIGRHEAEALSVVFNAPKTSKDDIDVRPAVDVPSELKSAVDMGKIAPTAAAKQITSERKRQGGEIKDPTVLKAWVDEKTTKKEKREPTHEERIEQQTLELNRDLLRLANIYKDIDDLLCHRPLKSIIGPSEHHRFSSLVRDIAIRCARELESVQATESVGKQVSLIAIKGGK